MDFIELPSRTRGAVGGFSMYFYLGKRRGVKILKGVFKSRKRAMRSKKWHKAIKEFQLLKRAEGSGLTPKAHGVTLVKRGHYWRVGIVMEHLGSTRLVDLKLTSSAQDRIIERVTDRLYKFGIEHDDIHEWNIMVRKGKRNSYFAVDFSPEYVWPINRRWERV